MSFLSDLIHGNFGNLGEDLAPQNIFKDTISSFQNQPMWAKGLEMALPVLLTAGAALPEMLAGAGAAEGGLAAAEAGAGAVDLTTMGGAAEAGLGAGVDTTAGVLGAEAGPFAGLPADLVASGGGTAATDVASATAALPPDIAGVAPDLNPALFQTVAGAGGESGPTVASTLTGDFSGGSFAAGTPGGVATGGATAPAAGSIFGPAPTAFDPGMGAPPIAFGGVGSPAAAAAGAPTPGVMDTLGSTFGSIGSGIKSAAPWLGAAGLGYSLFQGYQSQQAQKALQKQEQDYQNAIAGAGRASLAAAQPMLETGEALMTGGTVPAPMQALLDNFRNAQRARIIQGYGARNQNTDPTQNSALTADLNAVDNQMLALREQIGQQIVDTANTMLSQGVNATQIAARLPIIMQQLDMQLQQMEGNAIANFASAMSGRSMRVAGLGSGGQNLNINLTGGAGPLQV